MFLCIIHKDWFYSQLTDNTVHAHYMRQFVDAA